MRKTLTAALLAASLLTLAACGEDSEHDGHSASAVPASEPFNQADVDFATQMIQHHAQALSMVDLTEHRDLSLELSALAEQIRMAQGPEIETMVDWLTEWDQPIPETMRDHANAHGGEAEMNTEMPGMMSADDMAELEAAQGAEFERMWLQMMIEHHQGAITMVQDEIDNGENPDAVNLARAIKDGQTAEIEAIENLLDG